MPTIFPNPAGFPRIFPVLNGAKNDTLRWYTVGEFEGATGTVDIIGGDRLLTVISDNSTLQIINTPGASIDTITGVCELVITRLQ